MSSLIDLFLQALGPATSRAGPRPPTFGPPPAMSYGAAPPLGAAPSLLPQAFPVPQGRPLEPGMTYDDLIDVSAPDVPRRKKP